jgi:hypothetical protein
MVHIFPGAGDLNWRHIIELIFLSKREPGLAEVGGID